MQAKFLQGEPCMVDYTPGSAVAAGDVIVIGNGVRIAHTPIAASALGALAICCGEYEIVKDGGVFTDGQDVYWDATGDPYGGTENSGAATNTNTGVWIGKAVAGAAATATTVKVFHFVAPEAGLS